MSSGRINLFLALAALSAGASTAGEITFCYSLEPGGYDLASFQGSELVTCDGGFVGFEEGMPNLPVVSRCFVIPQGATVTGAGVEILSETALEGLHEVLPVRLTPFGRDPGPFLRDPSIYFSDDPFPAGQVVSLFTGTRTGFRLGSVSFTPFRYNPLSGRLTVIDSLAVTVRFELDQSVPVLPLTGRQISNAVDILEHIVSNPSDLASCSPPVHRPSTTVEWVAIGAASLESTLQPLVDLRNSLGMPAQYVTVEEICSEYEGWDTQERIRNYLMDAFETTGLMYALMVGDWGETQRISSLTIGSDSLLLGETTDLYYSDLTRMWDGDGDHLYGENNDWVDYYSDISVGRFSSGNAANIQTQVQKTIEYETIAPEGPWRTSALLCGAGLWPDVEPDGYWGSFVCDSIADRMPSNWTQYKRYETEAGHPTDQIGIINSGVSYVSDQGHGASSGVYWYFEPSNMFTNSNYTGMENWGMFPIFHSMACNPGQLSVNGCSAERLMMWPSGGAIAVMYNSNYGWGTPPAMGPSEHLELQFANMLFVNGIQRIGDMQSAARDAFKAWGSIACQNWVLQENNMLGDPATLFLSYQTGMGGAGGSAQGASLAVAFPNPSRGAFQIAWTLPCPGAFTIGVYDLAGRLVESESFPEGSGTSGTAAFDLSTDGVMPCRGCYLVRLESAAGNATARVMVMTD